MGILRRLRRIASHCVHPLDASVRLAADGMKKELGRRDGERGRGAFRWFTADEALTAEALARIIVPSDDTTPGIEEVSVLGPPATVCLDNLVQASLHRQYLYSRGLLGFDVWASKEFNHKFADLAAKQQELLLATAAQLDERWSGKMSAVNTGWQSLCAVPPHEKGVLYAAQLYPQIRRDCLEVFYTSRVSWIWLEYDGPPMNDGYPFLARRNQDSAQQHTLNSGSSQN